MPLALLGLYVCLCDVLQQKWERVSEYFPIIFGKGDFILKFKNPYLERRL